MNVVSRRDFSSKGICQKPLFASNSLNLTAPASWARVSPTLGIRCTSRHTLSLRGLRSTHILTAPDFFGTTTMPAHHGVGSVTLDMTPKASIRSSSACTFGHRGIGTLLDVKSACGAASSLSFISYTSPRFPKRVWYGFKSSQATFFYFIWFCSLI